ncbi:MAG: electron transfer flavoprotein subunit beta/FixA family protein [Candidatus Obscuribacterales bacterium]|nr:electron transfer flavoprotein subunit beta/FixA family protein [Candidatus Obscuribacterales bacterium]
MKIAVCVKSVPDTETKIAIAPDKKNIDLNGVRFITSPFDEFAIEEALKLKEKNGGDTTAISVGGKEVTDVLRDSLARGIDSAIHVDDPDLTWLDPLSTAKVLAAAIKDGGYDVILCGQQGVGGDNSQVPTILAELLDVPQVTLVVKLEIDGDKFKAEREIEGAHEFVEGTLPVVLSAQKGLNEPRYPSIKGVMAARRKEIVVKNAESLGIKGQVGGDNRKVLVKEMKLPPDREQGRRLEGDVDTQVKTLVELLRKEAHVI